MGLCGTLSLPAGCACARFNGTYQPLCGGACPPPPADGGTERFCSHPNCGLADCSTGTTCAAPNSCQ